MPGVIIIITIRPFDDTREVLYFTTVFNRISNLPDRANTGGTVLAQTYSFTRQSRPTIP